VSSLLKSRYGVGVLVLLLIGLGFFAFFYFDFPSAPWKATGKIPPPEKRPEALEAKKIPPPAGEGTGAKKDSPQPVKRPMPKLEEKTIRVKEGWTLSSVALQYFSRINHSLLDFMLEVNPEITDINLIFSGQKIKIPYITEETLLRRGPDNRYQLYLGTFATAQEAARYKDEPALREKKLKVISRRVSPQEDWYRIMAEEFETREEALNLIRTLKGKKLLPLLDCLPRKAL